MSRLYGNCFRAVAPSKQVRVEINLIVLAAFVSSQDHIVAYFALRMVALGQGTPHVVSHVSMRVSSLPIVLVQRIVHNLFRCVFRVY